MSFSCFVIDDERSALQHLARLVERSEKLTLIGSETKPKLALKKIQSGEIKADITFLDIDMPDISGIELAPLLQPYTTVVFITGHPDFAPIAYDLGIVDFILKPVSFERFEIGVEKALKLVMDRRIKQAPAADFIYLFADRKRKRIKLLFNEIIYLESESNNIKIFNEQEQLKIHDSMDNMENLLPAKHFMRIHRSFMINLEKITAYEDGMVTLSKKHNIPVGRKYKKQFMDRMGF